MTIETRRNVVGTLGFLFLGAMVAVAILDASRHGAGGTRQAVVPAESKACVQCHERVTPQTVAQWKVSMHGEKGIACLACHKANPGAPDGFLHHEARITMIVTPKVCSSCHKREADEFGRSPHAIGKADLKITLVGGKPDPKTWPLPLLGRINPDGSTGTCIICHGRHDFQAADAGRPSVCGSCHLSDGSAEAWQRSPHGAQFLTAAPGETPKGPTCASCHMRSAAKRNASHDVSSRVTWTRRADGKLIQRSDADVRRDAMFDMCLQCHGNSFVEGAFTQIDESFAAGKAASTPNPLEWFITQPAAWPHLSPVDRRRLMELQSSKR